MERTDLCDALAWIGEFAGGRRGSGWRSPGRQQEADQREEMETQQEMDDQQGIAECRTSVQSAVVAR
jgi:hypothetical protein